MKNGIKMFVIDKAYELLLVIHFVIGSLVWMSLENRVGVFGFWIGFLLFCWTLHGLHMVSRHIRERWQGKYLEEELDWHADCIEKLNERLEALEASKPESAKTSDNI